VKQLVALAHETARTSSWAERDQLVPFQRTSGLAAKQNDALVHEILLKMS
jgi:hypothetical protein